MSVYEFRLPDVGEGLDEAEIVQWLVERGQRVEADQIVVSVETAKAVVDLPVPVGGTIHTLGAQEGQVVAVGGVLLAVLVGDDHVTGHRTAPEKPDETGHEQTPGLARSGVPVPVSPQPAAAEADTVDSSRSETIASARRPLAPPVVRQLARKLGVDLSTVNGTGPSGRITRGDVEQAAHPDPPESATVTSPSLSGPSDSRLSDPRLSDPGLPMVPTVLASPMSPVPPPTARTRPTDVAAGTRIPFTGVRREVAKSTTSSWQSVPHIFDWRIADVTALLQLRDELRSFRPDLRDLGILPLLVRVAIAALRRHPILNSTLDEERREIVVHDHINLGVATAGPTGLVVPVLPDAGARDLAGLADGIRTLVEAARQRRLRVHDLTGATFTINNLGPLGASFGSPILRIGESGTVAFGKIEDRVVPRDGAPVVAPTMGVTVAGDHRVLDGAELCAFAGTMVELLERPALLVGDLR